MDLWKIEREYYEAGIYAVCGVDEAGRGPLAGPVYAAAVVLPPQIEIPGLNDSKKISGKKRELLFDEIRACANAYCISCASAQEIDEINILEAAMLAMRRAVEGLSAAPELVLADGNRNPAPLYAGQPVACIPVVKGDALSASIAAASILAKVSRDRFMLEMARKYPGYGFEQHKGYPTRAHYAALAELGPCPIHRRSFRLQ